MKSNELPVLWFQGIGKTWVSTVDDAQNHILLQGHHILKKPGLRYPGNVNLYQVRFPITSDPGTNSWRQSLVL